MKTTKNITPRQFTTISSWMETLPKEEEVQKVLDLINKTGKREMKQLLWNKRKELNRLTKFAEEMKELGFKPSEDIVNKTKTVIEEIQDLQTSIGPVITRKKKIAEVKEEFNVEENAIGVKQGPDDKSIKGLHKINGK